MLYVRLRSKGQQTLHVAIASRKTSSSLNFIIEPQELLLLAINGLATILSEALREIFLPVPKRHSLCLFKYRIVERGSQGPYSGQTRALATCRAGHVRAATPGKKEGYRRRFIRTGRSFHLGAHVECSDILIYRRWLCCRAEWNSRWSPVVFSS
jgi:hypothetical protein